MVEDRHRRGCGPLVLLTIVGALAGPMLFPINGNAFTDACCMLAGAIIGLCFGFVVDKMRP